MKRPHRDRILKRAGLRPIQNQNSKFNFHWKNDVLSSSHSSKQCLRSLGFPNHVVFKSCAGDGSRSYSDTSSSPFHLKQCLDSLKLRVASTSTALLFLLLTVAPLSSGTPWINEQSMHCEYETSSPPINYSFILPEKDTDTYFLALPHLPLHSVLCDKFTEWQGHSLTEVREIARQLPLTEHSDWCKWNMSETWVFLGYRGTSQHYAEEAARDGYRIHPYGGKLYGEGIYMSPRRHYALKYALERSNQPHGRICYNLAPKRILSHLLMCGLCNLWTCGAFSSFSPQVMEETPMEVSARFDFMDVDSKQRPYEVVYPEAFLPCIRILCIQAPDQLAGYNEIPELFHFNNVYFNGWKMRMQLSVFH